MKAKEFIKILTLGLLVVACNKSHDDLPILEKPKAIEPIEKTIERGSISLNPIIKDLIQVQTGKAPTLDELLDDMVVQIKDEDLGLDIVYSNYRDLPAEIPLVPGFYSLLISNYPSTSSRFDTGVYGHLSFPFFVASGANTPLNLELALFDVAATINFSGEIILSYPDITVKTEYIKDGFGIGPFLNWTTTDNDRTGYLSAYDGDYGFGDISETFGSMKVTIEATDSTGSPITVEKTYQNVSANKHYNITIEQTAATTTSLTVTLGGEDVIDDTITFPFN